MWCLVFVASWTVKSLQPFLMLKDAKNRTANQRWPQKVSSIQTYKLSYPPTLVSIFLGPFTLALFHHCTLLCFCPFILLQLHLFALSPFCTCAFLLLQPMSLLVKLSLPNFACKIKMSPRPMKTKGCEGSSKLVFFVPPPHLWGQKILTSLILLCVPIISGYPHHRISDLWHSQNKLPPQVSATFPKFQRKK